MTGRNLITAEDAGEGSTLPPLTVAGLLRPVLRHKLLLLGTMLLFIGAAVAFLMIVHPRYTSSAVVLIKPTNPEAIVGELRDQLRLMPDQEEVRSQIEVIRSRALLEPTVELLQLAADPDFNPSLEPSLLSRMTAGIREFLDREFFNRLGLRSAGQPEPPHDTVEVLQRRLQVNTLNRSHVVEIALETRNPQLGRDTVNAIADAYQAFTLQNKSSLTDDASRQLTDRIDELQRSIGAVERRIEDIREQAGIMQGRTASLMAEQVSDVNAELFRVRSQAETLATRQKIIEQALSRGGDLSSAIDVSQSPVIGGLRQREAQLRAHLAQLSTSHGDRNPQLVAARFELADVQRFIDAELRKIEAALANELSMAREREAELRREFATLSEEVSKTAQAELEIKALEHGVATDRPSPMR